MAGLTGDSGSLEDLVTMVYDRDMEIENLWDRVDELEAKLGEKVEAEKIRAQQAPEISEEKATLERWLAELKAEVQDKDHKIYELTQQKQEFLSGFGIDAKDWDEKIRWAWGCSRECV